MATKAEPKALEYDPSPEFAVEIRSDGTVSHFMAFDHRYGPESQDQIDFFKRRNYPGADKWEVGKPIRVAGARAAAAGEAAA
jgi:hypothetical protein